MFFLWRARNFGPARVIRSLICTVNVMTPRCSIIFVLCYSIVMRNGDCFPNSTYYSTENSKQNISNNDGTTTEIHYTTCKIMTEKLVADAQTTFTRVITGAACNPQIIEERFEKLERSLSERLNELRDLIISSMTKENFDFSKSNKSEVEAKMIFEKNNNFSDGNVVDDDENKFDNDDERNVPMSSRQDEVERYNNTVHEDEKRRRVYTYHWRVSNLYEKLLQWKTGRSERSSSFYVGDAGYAMYLRFTPKYFPDGTIFISVGLTSGRNDSKLIWPFPLKFRIEILDLASSMMTKNRSSRLWDPATVCSSYFWGRPRQWKTGSSSDNPECVGLSISRQSLTIHGIEQPISSALSSSSTASIGNYPPNDSLLVKLTVYL